MADETVGEATAPVPQEDTNPIPKVTRPARRRASGAAGGAPTTAKAKPATATKAKPAKVAETTSVEPAPVATPAPAPVDDGLVRTVLEFTYFGDTKTYSRFNPPEDSGCVGSVYAPLGTTNVRVLLVQPAE